MARKSTIAKYLAEIGGRGGKARLKTMTPAERRAVASKAGKASVKARAAKKAAKARKP